MSRSDALTCRDVEDHVTDYLEAALAPDVLLPYEAHLAECPECVAFLRQTRLSIALTHTLASRPVAPVSRDRLLRVFRDWKSGELS
jgi:hypothetical protein